MIDKESIKTLNEAKYEHCKNWYKDGELITHTWKEALLCACNCYGTFSGRWHSNKYWAELKNKLPDMSESECHAKYIEIEREADASLATWQMYQ